MTLRNVPKAHTLEQQRQEINLIASDLDTAVDGTKTFGGDKTFSSNVTFQSTVDFGGIAVFNSSPTFTDNVEARFGDNADLKIYYDGSVGVLTSFIDSDALQIRSESDTSELYATFLKDGPVELYYDGTKKFGTSASGASVLGNLEVNTDITCNSIISNAGGTPTFSIFNTGNAVFEDVEATSLHMKDDRPAYFGTNEDASLYYDNASSELRLESEVGFHVRWYDSVNTQYEDQVIFSPFGSTRFYYQGDANPTLLIDDGIDIDGVVKIEQTGGTGEVRLAVGGTQANYLKVFGSSGETYIRNDDNDIGNTATTINIQGRTGVALWQSTGNLGLQVDSSCAVKLYYQTAEKLKTTTNGVEITGGLKVDGILESSLLVNTNNTPTAGEGIEMFYDSAASGGAAGGIQAYDRDGAALTRLKIKSSNWEIENDGSATFAGNLTLSDDTKEVTTQKIRPITTGTGSIMTIGGSNLGALSFEADVAVFDQIGFMAFSSAGLNLGPYGTGALNVTNGTGVNGIFRRYEEGTWSPDFLGLSAAFTSYSNKVGNYTRIGDVVHVHGFIQLSAQPSFTTATDHLKIGPLPFNHDSSKNGGYNVTVGGVQCQNFNFHDNDYSNTGQVSCGINTDATSGDSYVIFQVSGNNNIRGIVKNSAIGADDIIEFQMSYQA